jgi:Rad3-related DNA helicase
MKTRASILPAAACLLTLLCLDSYAQTSGRTTAQEQQPAVTQSAAALDPVANEISLLRKSLQTLNTRLREIGERLLAAPDAKQAAAAGDPKSRLAQHLEVLTRAEQRAETLRRELLEMIRCEAVYRNRLVQIDEDMRPESIDRNLTLVGTTRSTTDLRDLRRRVLDNERKGVENLLNQTAQSRLRLEDDVKMADEMVARIRKRLLPLIDKEIDKINPEEKQ